MRDTVTIEEPKVARFFFASPAAAPIWLVARLWLGYQWLHAGWEKVTGTESGWHWAFTSQSWLRSSGGLKGFAGFALTQSKSSTGRTGLPASEGYIRFVGILFWNRGGTSGPTAGLAASQSSSML